jgi:hypothetical protein
LVSFGSSQKKLACRGETRRAAPNNSPTKPKLTIDRQTLK